MSVLSNIRYGKIAELLRPVVYGEGEFKELPHYLRAEAINAIGYDVTMTSRAVDFFMPIFVDQTLSNELRTYAFHMIMNSRPSPNDFSTIMAVLAHERDFEVRNFVYSVFEKYSESRDPCDRLTREYARYYMKYMKQYNGFETDYSMGVSKSYSLQFNKETFGYTGSYDFYVIGSNESTTPLSFGLGVNDNYMKSYKSNFLWVHFRVEGLGRVLLEQFRNMNPTTWDFETIRKVYQTMGK